MAAIITYKGYNIKLVDPKHRTFISKYKIFLGDALIGSAWSIQEAKGYINCIVAAEAK